MMGELTSGSDSTESYDDYLRTSKTAMIVLVLLGLLSPVLYSSYGGYLETYIQIQSILWSFSIGSWGPGFTFMPIYFLISAFPFVILRFVPAAQIQRYYKGKSSRRRSFILLLVGDIYFILGASVVLIVSLFLPYMGLSIPLPFQTLVGYFYLLRHPVREPITPWDSELKPKQWWDETQQKNIEPVDVKDDTDELW